MKPHGHFITKAKIAEPLRAAIERMKGVQTVEIFNYRDAEKRDLVSFTVCYDPEINPFDLGYMLGLEAAEALMKIALLEKERETLKPIK